MKNLLAVIAVIALLILPAVGWVKNIYKLTECDFEKPYKAEVIHTVGLIPIVGAVTGWIDVGK